MNKIQALSAIVLAAALSVCPSALANGDHPAVIAKRMQAQHPYDYAAQFYAHPAGLALSTEMPNARRRSLPPPARRAD